MLGITPFPKEFEFSDIFSYLSIEQKTRKDHLLREVRAVTDEIMEAMSPQINAMYAEDKRPSTVDLHGEKRSNETHESQTDPDAILMNKAKGKEAKSSYSNVAWIFTFAAAAYNLVRMRKLTPTRAVA